MFPKRFNSRTPYDIYIYIYIYIYLSTEIGLTPGGSSTVHIYTQTVHRTTQLTTLVGGLSGIRTQSWPQKIFTDPNILVHVNIERPDGWNPKLKSYISDLILDR